MQLTLVAVALLIGAADDIVVKELDLKGLRRDFPKGSAERPTVITTADELAKAFPEEAVRERLKKDVDFAKQQLLFFAWSGSGGDKLLARVADGKVVFAYQRGLTRDLRGHMKLFVLPKGATWRVDGK